MASDIHLTDVTHCPERVFTTHNNSSNERRIGAENMTAKGTCNTTQNMLINIQPLRYIENMLALNILAAKLLTFIRRRSLLKGSPCIGPEEIFKIRVPK